jgi:hypothetical protein
VKSEFTKFISALVVKTVGHVTVLMAILITGIAW